PVADQLSIEVGGFPTVIRPMQAVSAEAPFSSDQYFFEVRWNGLRCLLFADAEGRVRLQDSSLADVTYRFPEFGTVGAHLPPSTGRASTYRASGALSGSRSRRSRATTSWWSDGLAGSPSRRSWSPFTKPGVCCRAAQSAAVSTARSAASWRVAWAASASPLLRSSRPRSSP